MSRLEEIRAQNETERWTTQERQEKVRWLIARVERLEKSAGRLLGVFSASPDRWREGLSYDEISALTSLYAELDEPAGGVE